MKANRYVFCPPITMPCNASPVHNSFGRAASNRPNTDTGPSPGRCRPCSAKWRCNVRSPGAQPSWVRRIRRTWVAVRSGFSRFSATANSMISAGSLELDCRGLGTNASNPPRRQARIHRSRVSRETRTRLADQLVAEQPDRPSPLGPGCLLIVSDRHRRPPVHLIHKGQAQRITTRSTPRQGELVLIHSTGQPGANNRPPDTPTATSHGATLPTPNRIATAAAAAPIAAIASDHAVPAGSGITGSGSSARTHPVNTDRTTSTRPANRRSQSRTVSTGRPNAAAIRRYPTPSALATNAAPIVTATSARRSNATTGNNTCVTPQPVHRDRRGRVHNGPSGPRSTRARAWPHPASTPAHSGQLNIPAANRCSTPSASTPTVTTAPPCALARPSRGTPARDDGRAVAYHNLVTVAAPITKNNPPS